MQLLDGKDLLQFIILLSVSNPWQELKEYL